MAKTPDTIRRYARNPDAIVEAGELTDWRFPVGSHQLSLRAAKIFHLLIQAAGIKITDDTEHRVTFAYINEIFHISIADLEATIDELHSTILKIRLTKDDGTSYTKSGPILADAERDDETTNQAELRYTFSPTLRLAIADSNHWAVLSRRAVLAFQSKYALRLYALISLRIGLRKTSETFALTDLRQILGIPENNYPAFGNFKQRVLAPAIAELNQLSGFQVGFRPRKNGRSVVAVDLFWGVKDDLGRKEALKELERPSVGRKARREGNVALIADTEAIERQEIALALSKLGGNS